MKSSLRRTRRTPMRNGKRTTTAGDHQPETVYYEVQGPPSARRVVTWPMREGVSDAAVVDEAGGLLWKRAQRDPRNHLVAGAARVLHALSAILRTGDRRAQQFLSALERLCLEYDPDDRAGGHWSTTALPPRAKLDRARNLRVVVELAELLRRGVSVAGGEPSISIGAEFLLKAICRLFPQHAIPAVKVPAASQRVVERWERRAKRTGSSGDVADIDPELLAVDAFAVLDVPGPIVHNWLKGI